MSGPNPVALILGSGPNVGKHVAQTFAAKGYKVALSSRKANSSENTSDQFHFQADLSDPESVSGVYSKVTEELGTPSVVVYNAAVATRSEDPKDPFAVPHADFTRDLNVNTISAYAAAQQAILGFEKLPESASKTFIYTGNFLNTTILSPFMTLGVGKSASAHFIQYAAATYADRGFKFYYADERMADGSPAYHGVDGEAHAKLYDELVESKSQRPWLQTFVKGVGYKTF
ncbi:hypothetical protein FQN54_007953 [Arachnomyces sp. PD_36]|nr:hypothetical protein FQN54_007953 [Arachnomyces sp. PD_36]